MLYVFLEMHLLFIPCIRCPRRLGRVGLFNGSEDSYARVNGPANLGLGCFLAMEYYTCLELKAYVTTKGG